MRRYFSANTRKREVVLNKRKNTSTMKLEPDLVEWIDGLEDKNYTLRRVEDETRILTPRWELFPAATRERPQESFFNAS